MIQHFPPEHPIWKTLDALARAGAAVVIIAGWAYAKATNFDQGEVEMIAGSGTMLAVLNILLNMKRT